MLLECQRMWMLTVAWALLTTIPPSRIHSTDRPTLTLPTYIPTSLPTHPPQHSGAYPPTCVCSFLLCVCDHIKMKVPRKVVSPGANCTTIQSVKRKKVFKVYTTEYFR